MCGIFYTRASPTSSVVASSRTLMPRGPDESREISIDEHFFAFHRLRINDLSSSGMQPWVCQDYVFMCNGEIYNSNELRAKLSNVQFQSNSDCEVVPHLILRFGIETALSMIQGVFAFVFLHRPTRRVFIARDAIGIKSLYVGIRDDEVFIENTSSLNEMTGILCHEKYGDKPIVVASEMKAIHSICQEGSITQFPAGHYYDSTVHTLTQWAPLRWNPRPCESVASWAGDVGNIRESIRNLLTEAVRVRLETSDRPVGCFLSGGLDSSLVAAIAAKMVRERSIGKQKIKTFSVGIKGATDLDAAAKVAKWIGSEHHQLILSEKDMLRAVPQTIKRIESYDVTTVRASTPMVILSDYIKLNFDTTVLFSGEGADELSGSYKYFQNAPTPEKFQKESVRLVQDLQYFDVLRCDKSVSGSGLEARTPFFDMNFVNFYMRINPALKLWSGGAANAIEKQLLRDSFKPREGKRGLLPPELLYRRKEAFSDGCSSMERPWFKVIDDHVNAHISDQEYKERRMQFSINRPISKEGYWFRAIYEQFYPGRGAVVPYIWRPKWTNETNPSARLL